MKVKRTPIESPADWKRGIRAQLDAHGMSRYSFIRACEERSVCSVHTGECLLADDDTVTGQRVPSLQTAIDMARIAGFDLVFVPRYAPKGMQ